MQLKQFFTSQYLFQVNPAYISPREKLVFMAGVVFLLLAIVLKIAAGFSATPVEKHYRQKFFRFFLYGGLLELVWYLCRYENVSFFDSRFVLWLLNLVLLVWLVGLLVRTIRHYGPAKNEWNKSQLKEKYLPK